MRSNPYPKTAVQVPSKNQVSPSDEPETVPEVNSALTLLNNEIEMMKGNLQLLSNKLVPVLHEAVNEGFCSEQLQFSSPLAQDIRAAYQRVDELNSVVKDLFRRLEI